MRAALDRSSSDAEAGVRRYLGKFRGTVVNNVDVKGIARLQVQVPDVSPLPLVGWALPCAPVGGIQNGFVAVPPIGSGVWVEFEQGDPDYPIWTGCFWGSAAEVPSRSKPVTVPLLQSITLQTPLRNSVVISDLPGPAGGVQIRTGTESKINVTDVSIEIDNGKGASIQLVGPVIRINASLVNINNGALTIA
jgi:uncharacterized protein involved in type VI secretion and phage assembly